MKGKLSKINKRVNETEDKNKWKMLKQWKEVATYLIERIEEGKRRSFVSVLILSRGRKRTATKLWGSKGNFGESLKYKRN